MSNSKTMNQVLAETQDFIMKKQASFSKRAKDQALDNPSSIPGSSHDSPFNSAAGASDKEVSQGMPSMNQRGQLAEVLESGHATDALTPESGVKSKPMVSTDVKEASTGATKHASDLLSMINTYKKNVQVKRAKADVESLEEEEEEEEEDLEDVNAEDLSPEDAAILAALVKGDATEEGKEEEEEGKEASNNSIELTRDVLAKIACTILSTDEGCTFTEKLLQKQAGSQAARDTMAFLQNQSEKAEKVASYHAGTQDAENLIKQALSNQDSMNKQAAYDNGVRDAAAFIQEVNSSNTYRDLGAQVAEQAVKRAQAEMMGMDPESMGEEALGGMGGMPTEANGMMPPEMEGDLGDDSEISAEDLMEALAAMVQSGEITPEEVEQILSQIDATEGADETGEAVGAEEEQPMEVTASARRLAHALSSVGY